MKVPACLLPQRAIKGIKPQNDNAWWHAGRRGRHNFRKQRGGNAGGSGGDISFRKLWKFNTNVTLFKCKASRLSPSLNPPTHPASTAPSSLRAFKLLLWFRCNLIGIQFLRFNLLNSVFTVKGSIVICYRRFALWGWNSSL